MTGIEAGGSGLLQEDILARLLHPMINEALVILEENKAQRASDIDVIWSFGYGWPGDTGGPMFYGDLIGAEKFSILCAPWRQVMTAQNPPRRLKN